MKGEKVTLRAVEPEDVELLYNWENKLENWKVSNTLAPFPRNVLEQYAKSDQDLYAFKQARFMICEKETDETVGCVDVFDLDLVNDRAGVGVLIAKPEYREKGYAKEALEILIKYAFEILNLHQLYCNIPADNEKSLKLFEQIGFQKTGTFHDWIKRSNVFVDEYTLQLINK
jgi:diamine N-acetyltransferase